MLEIIFNGKDGFVLSEKIKNIKLQILSGESTLSMFKVLLF